MALPCSLSSHPPPLLLPLLFPATPPFLPLHLDNNLSLWHLGHLKHLNLLIRPTIRTSAVHPPSLFPCNSRRRMGNQKVHQAHAPPWPSSGEAQSCSCCSCCTRINDPAINLRRGLKLSSNQYPLSVSQAMFRSNELTPFSRATQDNSHSQHPYSYITHSQPFFAPLS